MILNMQAGAPNLKIELTKCLISEYAVSSSPTSWTHAPWAHKNIQDISTTNSSLTDGDAGAYYVGAMEYSSGGNPQYWASRLTITMPNSNQLLNKFVIKATMIHLHKTQYMRAFLTNTVPDSAEKGDPANLANKTILATSYYYTSPDASEQYVRTANASTEEVDGYFVFNYPFAPGATYYIYIYPYSDNSTSMTTPDWTDYNTMVRFRNYGSLTECYLTT